MLGIGAGIVLAGHYRDYLLFLHGREFGRDDPVFGHDIGFYVFDLPAIRTTVEAAIVLVLRGARGGRHECARSAAPRASARRAWGGSGVSVGRAASPSGDRARPPRSRCSRPSRSGSQRYDLLTKDNTESSIPTGAQALDVTGLFSTKNAARRRGAGRARRSPSA